MFCRKERNIDDIVPMVYVDIVGKNPKIIKESIENQLRSRDRESKQLRIFDPLWEESNSMRGYILIKNALVRCLQY